MRLQKRADGVIFANESLEKEFESLPEEDWLKKSLKKAMEDLKENVFAGENIPKKLIPKEYKSKYGLDNAWWYPLPNAWRLIYFILTPSNTEILASILEYFDHKDYAKRFHYKT